MQDYTQGFREKSLILGVNLQSQDTLLKYIGGLHSYLRYTILMSNPNSLDEVCVQATHLQARGKNTPKEGSKNSFKGKRKKMVSKGREIKMNLLIRRDRN